MHFSVYKLQKVSQLKDWNSHLALKAAKHNDMTSIALFGISHKIETFKEFLFY